MAVAKLRILGCGEAFDSGLGNNSCLLYGRQVPTLLFDCGYQIPERLWAFPKIYPKLDGVFLTHTHADHAFGLVPLIVRFAEEGRTWPLQIAGPHGVESYLRKLLDLGYPGIRQKLPFQLRFVKVADGGTFEWGGLRLSCARSEHSVMNLAVRVEGCGTLQGLSFGISGDGQMNQKTQALFQNVGILLHEVYTGKKDLLTHCNLKTLSKFVADSAIHRVGITHVSRGAKPHMRRLYSQLRKRDARWFWLKPGMEIGLQR